MIDDAADLVLALSALDRYQFTDRLHLRDPGPEILAGGRLPAFHVVSYRVESAGVEPFRTAGSQRRTGGGVSNIERISFLRHQIWICTDFGSMRPRVSTAAAGCAGLPRRMRSGRHISDLDDQIGGAGRGLAGDRYCQLVSFLKLYLKLDYKPWNTRGLRRRNVSRALSHKGK